MTPPDRPTREDVFKAIDDYFEKACGFSCRQCPAPTDEDLAAAMRSFNMIRAGIVIDRDKVPQGLRDAVADVQSDYDNELIGPHYLTLKTVLKAAALLAEKSEG